MHTGDNIAIYVQAKEPPYVHHGIMRSEGEEYIRIEGTVGDLIGKDILVPKARITHIVIHKV